MPYRFSVDVALLYPISEPFLVCLTLLSQRGWNGDFFTRACTDSSNTSPILSMRWALREMLEIQRWWNVPACALTEASSSLEKTDIQGRLTSRCWSVVAREEQLLWARRGSEREGIMERSPWRRAVKLRCEADRYEREKKRSGRGEAQGAWHVGSQHVQVPKLVYTAASGKQPGN